MSAVEYNNLLFKISQRLNELNVGEQLLAMCEGMATRSEENVQDASLLFGELKEKEFLGPDRLDVLKELLEGVEEWSLLEKVEKFEKTRKEYNDLLEQIIRVLDELNDLERLIAMCRGKIEEGRQGNVHDVRSLFKELENNNCLGINRLVILKEILAQTEKSDLLKEVEEFEQRRSREKKFERRKAQAAAIVSSASGNLAGVLNIKTMFKVVGGGIVVASAYELLRRGSTYDQLITAVNTCVLPAGAKLIQIIEGSVYLKVQAENVSALHALWSLYKDGTLEAGLQALMVTDEMRELAGGEQVEVIVTIDEQEYEKARHELTNEAEGSPDDREEEQLKYLDQEKFSYIQSYLEDTDAYSITTEASDSGMPGSSGAPSEFGMEETSDSTSKLYLKDLSQEVTAELTSRLQSDKIALERFYKLYGLDRDKLFPERLKTLFPDTPVKMLKDVFEALQLYDFVELLEKVKPRTLRPALPMKEIGKLLNASNRQTKFYTKAEVLIIKVNESAAEDKDGGTESFFKTLNSRSEITTLTAKPVVELAIDISKLMETEKEEEQNAQFREERLRKLLEKKIPSSMWWELDEINWERRHYHGPSDWRLVQFQEEEREMKKELKQLVERREQWTKEGKLKIEQEMKQKQKELKGEIEKFEMAVSTVMDKWMQHAQDKGEGSTLFVVITVNDGRCRYQQLQNIIERCLKEKLAFIPNTKLVITNSLLSWKKSEEIPRETLHVSFSDYWQSGVVLTAMLELLKKRWQKLDLISVMLELQRTVAIKSTPQYGLPKRRVNRRENCEVVEVQENLSCLPRLEKTEEI